MLQLALVFVLAINPVPVAAAAATAAPATPTAQAKKKPAAKATPAATPTPAAPAPEPAPAPAPAPAVVIPPAPQLPEGAKGGALRVAVLDPAKVGDIPERPLVAFEQALVPEIRKLEGVSAIGMGEVRDMLAFDRQRQLLGCSDESCLAEIGGALGVDEIISTQLTLTANAYTLSMKRVSLKKAKVIQAETKHFDKRDGEELLAEVGPMVASLFPGKALKAGKTRGVDKEVARKLNPPPLPRWVFVSTTGAGLVALAGAGMFGILMKDSQNQYNTKAQSSVNSSTPVQGSDLKSLENDANSRALTANILFAVAGGLAVVGGVEVFFTDWRGDRAALSLQPVALVGGGGFNLAGSF